MKKLRQLVQPHWFVFIGFISVFAIPPSKATSNPIVLSGIHIEMDVNTSRNILEDRGYECINVQDELSSITNSTQQYQDFQDYLTNFEFILFCVDPASIDGIIDLIEGNTSSYVNFFEQRAELALQPPERVTDRSPGGVLGFYLANNFFLEFFDETLQFFGSMIETVSFILFYENSGNRQIFFSCGSFNSCGEPASIVVSTLFSGREFVAREPVVFRPNLFELINDLGYNVVSSIIDETTDYGVIEFEWFEFLQEILVFDVMNFDETLSICGYGSTGDRLCFYDGAVRVSPARSPTILASSGNVVDVERFIGGVAFEIRLFSIDNPKVHQEEMNFD